MSLRSCWCWGKHDDDDNGDNGSNDNDDYDYDKVDDNVDCNVDGNFCVHDTENILQFLTDDGTDNGNLVEIRR